LGKNQLDDVIEIFANNSWARFRKKKAEKAIIGATRNSPSSTAEQSFHLSFSLFFCLFMKAEHII